MQKPASDPQTFKQSCMYKEMYAEKSKLITLYSTEDLMVMVEIDGLIGGLIH